MPINSRNKGATFERSIAARLTHWSKVAVRRILDQSRDGGHDLRLGRWRIECKCYRSLGLIERAMRQCEVGALATDLPMVIAKQNLSAPVVVMRLDTFLSLTERIQLGMAERPWE